MKTESEILTQYSSFLQDEQKLDSHIDHESNSMKTMFILFVIYIIISSSMKDYEYKDLSLINGYDITFGLIFLLTIIRSTIKLHFLYILKAVLVDKRSSKEQDTN